MLWIIAVLAITAATSCLRKLDIESTAATSQKQMWRTYDDAKAGLAALYGLTRAALADNNAHWMYGDLRMGDFVSTVPGNYLDAIIKNQLNSGLPEVRRLTNWRRFYAAIDACNTFIENARNCRQDLRYSKTNSTVDIAQAHLLRSFLYFYMTRIWGDVPLIRSATKEGVNNQVGRTPQATVMNFCINEVLLFKDSLPTEFGGDDKSWLNYDGDYYGANWASLGNSFWGYYQALGLLAQMYAWTGNYEQVRIWAEKIKNDDAAKTHAAFVGVWEVKDYLTGSNSIFYSNGVKGSACYQLVSLPYNMANRESDPSGVGHIESLTLAAPYISRTTPGLYIPRDTLEKWFYYFDDFRNPYLVDFGNYDEVYFYNYYGTIPVFSKFKTIAPGSDNFTIFGSCIPLYRMEDNQLLLAEAYYALGMGDPVYRALNEVRIRRNAPGYRWPTWNYRTTIDLYPTPESMQGGTLYNIFRERRIELAGEGTRWYDQVRYNKLTRHDPVFNKLLDEGGIYWPIDQEIIDRNPLIEQNSYWKK